MKRLKKWIKSRAFTNQVTILLGIIVIVLGTLTYGALTASGPMAGSSAETVYFLINLDLIVFLLLVSLIIRRIYILWRRRTKRAAGTGLQLRLISSFALVAVIPAVLMALFSLSFFHFALQSWFSERVETAVTESRVVARAYLEEHKRVIEADILAMANDLNRDALALIGNASLLTKVIEKQSFIRNFSEVIILRGDGQTIAKTGLTFSLEFAELPIDNIAQARGGNVVLMTDNVDNRVRAMTQLTSYGDVYAYVGRYIDPTVLAHIETAETAADEYDALNLRKSDFQKSFTLIFAFIALFTICGAILFGLIFARRLATPLENLIRGTERIRSGDFNVQIPMKDKEGYDITDMNVGDGRGNDELDMLVVGFNKMTKEIEYNRKNLIEANRLLDQRRHFIEAIFSGVSSGIIGIDKDKKITLTNESAKTIFDLKDITSNHVIGLDIKMLNVDIAQMLDKGIKDNQDLLQDNIILTTKTGKQKTVLVRIAFEKKDEEQLAVISLEDVTELISAQSQAAWSGVARRIAHEIKNPLTPIQLSAERLERKYKKQITDDPETFISCTQTIIRQVDEIGRMVNSFAEFARMPEPTMKPQEIYPIIKEAVSFQKQAYSNVQFSIHNDLKAVGIKVLCDKGLMMRAFQNILKNALEAQMHKDDKDEKIISIALTKKKKNILITINDNGSGFAPETLSKASNPYITTKEKGTGLGLSIVKKIIEDHDGALSFDNRVVNNCVIGATVIVSLPQHITESDEI